MAAARICVLRHSYYPEDVRVRRQANVLVASGFDVDIVCLRLPGQPTREHSNGATVYRLPLVHRRASRLRYAFQYLSSLVLSGLLLTALHLRKRYDIVQVSTMPDFLIFAAMVPKIFGAKLVLDMLDPTPELYMAKYRVHTDHPLVRLIALQEGASMRMADRVITVLEEVKRILVARHGHEDIAVVMNCPDHTVFPRRAPAPPADKSTGQSEGRFVMLSHGVVVERLGYDTAVRAVALLKDRIPGIELRIAGWGEYAEDLRRLADSLGVGDRVRILGFLPLEQIPHLVEGADLGVVANKNDGFADLPLPTKLLEYAWMGKPAVVARTSTVVNYFDESMVAFFEPGDERQLAQRVLELYQHPTRRHELATNAGRFFDRHNWQREGEHYRDILVDLLAHGQAHDTIRQATGNASAEQSTIITKGAEK